MGKAIKAIVVYVEGKLEVICTNKTNAWMVVEDKSTVSDLFVQGKKTPWLPASYGQVALRLGKEPHSCSMFTKAQTEAIDALDANDPNAVAPRPACRLLQMDLNYDRTGKLYKSKEREGGDEAPESPEVPAETQTEEQASA